MMKTKITTIWQTRMISLGHVELHCPLKQGHGGPLLLAHLGLGPGFDLELTLGFGLGLILLLVGVYLVNLDSWFLQLVFYISSPLSHCVHCML